MPASYFKEQNSAPEILYFKIDKSISDVRNDLAGVVKVLTIIPALIYTSNYSLEFGFTIWQCHLTYLLDVGINLL